MPKEMSSLFGLLYDTPTRISEMDLGGENPKNLFALVLLSEFKGGEAEEDVARSPRSITDSGR